MKRVQYPNGFIGTASDKVAEILAKKPDHKILTDSKILGKDEKRSLVPEGNK